MRRGSSDDCAYIEVLSQTDSAAQIHITPSKNLGKSQGEGEILLSVLGLFGLFSKTYNIHPVPNLSPNVFMLTHLFKEGSQESEHTWYLVAQELRGS